MMLMKTLRRLSLPPVTKVPCSLFSVVWYDLSIGENLRYTGSLSAKRLASRC